MNDSRICIALDFQNKEKVIEFLDRFEEEKLYVKVGMELFYGEGIEMVKAIKERGHKIFLDLKLHDIPNTVKSAMKQLAKLDVDIVNVHASGSVAMMKAAIQGLEEGKTGDKRPLCIAVTCLTSLDQEVLDNELLIHEPLNQVVLQWAKNAKEAVQWTYFGYLAAIKENNGAAMSLGRVDSFLEIYIERDFKRGILKYLS